MATEWENFLRIDDEGNEVIPKIVEKEDQEKSIEPDKGEKIVAKDAFPKVEESSGPIVLLDEMIARYERLPGDVQMLPINHYDYLSLLYLLKAMQIQKP